MTAATRLGLRPYCGASLSIRGKSVWAKFPFCANGTPFAAVPFPVAETFRALAAAAAALAAREPELAAALELAFAPENPLTPPVSCAVSMAMSTAGSCVDELVSPPVRGLLMKPETELDWVDPVCHAPRLLSSSLCSNCANRASACCCVEAPPVSPVSADGATGAVAAALTMGAESLRSAAASVLWNSLWRPARTLPTEP